MEKVTLPDNHKRALAAAMFLIEKLADELEYILNSPGNKVMEEITGKKDNEKYNRLPFLTGDIKSYIRYISDKYVLEPSTFSIEQVINSRKSKMWEILSDTKSTKMKGRGEFPKEYAGEFDDDIDRLLQLIQNI